MERLQPARMVFVTLGGGGGAGGEGEVDGVGEGGVGDERGGGRGGRSDRDDVDAEQVVVPCQARSDRWRGRRGERHVPVLPERSKTLRMDDRPIVSTTLYVASCSDLCELVELRLNRPPSSFFLARTTRSEKTKT